MLQPLLADAALQTASRLMLAVFIGVNLLMIMLAIPLIRRQVKPNPLYGVRTPKTLSDERVWYEANAYAGRLLLRLGMMLIVTVLMLYCLLAGQFVAFSVACGVAQVGGLAVTVYLSFRQIRSL
jgi:uncharacterized membrane protein